MPTSIPRQDGWSLFAHTPIHFGFPSRSGGSAPARCFRGLLDVYACSGLQARQVAKRVSLPPLSLRLLPGGANQFPGGDSHSTVDQRLFHGARRVEMWRGGVGAAYLLPTLSVAGASLAVPCSVSTSRSSNRTCGTTASGSRRRLTPSFACSAFCNF